MHTRFHIYYVIQHIVSIINPISVKLGGVSSFKGVGGGIKGIPENQPLNNELAEFSTTFNHITTSLVRYFLDSDVTFMNKHIN